MSKLAKRRDFDSIQPESRSAWRRWLKKNHTRTESIWIVLLKKDAKKGSKSGTDPDHFGYKDVVEEALCFGWIDGLINGLDDKRYKLLVSPRKNNSAWSALNKRRISALIKSGQMTPHGLEKVRQAKASGNWNALEKSDKLLVPGDLAKGLARNKKAREFFAKMAPSSKRAILEWINTAKRPETRHARIRETVALAARGIRANHYADKKKSGSPEAPGDKPKSRGKR